MLYSTSGCILVLLDPEILCDDQNVLSVLVRTEDLRALANNQDA